MTTMFDRYGGFATVSRIVSAFYDQVMDTPELEGYFENTNMARLIDHQTKFVSAVMGGPASYTNTELERTHGHLDIDQKAFEEMIALFTETLEDFDFAESDIATLRAELIDRSKYVISR